VLKALGEVIDEMGIQNQSIFLIDIGCSLLAWDFFDIPTTQTHHGRTVPVAMGFKKADPKKIVIAYQGDGGGYAIGLQHTITSCLRNDPITTILVNNTVYAMTGGQSAPTTFDKEITATTPKGKRDEFVSLRGPEMLSALGNKKAFIARGSIDKPLVLKDYLRRAIERQIDGHYSFIEALSSCPTNWKTDAENTIKIVKSLEKFYKLGLIS
jgi:2-oxoglutarate ferredoxin oxidoreductase subunit beta